MTLHVKDGNQDLALKERYRQFRAEELQFPELIDLVGNPEVLEIFKIIDEGGKMRGAPQLSNKLEVLFKHELERITNHQLNFRNGQPDDQVTIDLEETVRDFSKIYRVIEEIYDILDAFECSGGPTLQHEVTHYANMFESAIFMAAERFGLKEEVSANLAAVKESGHKRRTEKKEQRRLAQQNVEISTPAYGPSDRVPFSMRPEVVDALVDQLGQSQRNLSEEADDPKRAITARFGKVSSLPVEEEKAEDKEHVEEITLDSYLFSHLFKQVFSESFPLENHSNIKPDLFYQTVIGVKTRIKKTLNLELTSQIRQLAAQDPILQQLLGEVVSTDDETFGKHIKNTLMDYLKKDVTLLKELVLKEIGAFVAQRQRLLAGVFTLAVAETLPGKNLAILDQITFESLFERSKHEILNEFHRLIISDQADYNYFIYYFLDQEKKAELAELLKKFFFEQLRDFDGSLALSEEVASLRSKVIPESAPQTVLGTAVPSTSPENRNGRVTSPFDGEAMMSRRYELPSGALQVPPGAAVFSDLLAGKEAEEEAPDLPTLPPAAPINPEFIEHMVTSEAGANPLNVPTTEQVELKDSDDEEAMPPTMRADTFLHSKFIGFAAPEGDGEVTNPGFRRTNNGTLIMSAVKKSDELPRFPLADENPAVGRGYATTEDSSAYIQGTPIDQRDTLFDPVANNRHLLSEPPEMPPVIIAADVAREVVAKVPATEGRILTSTKEVTPITTYDVATEISQRRRQEAERVDLARQEAEKAVDALAGKLTSIKPSATSNPPKKKSSFIMRAAAIMTIAGAVALSSRGLSSLFSFNQADKNAKSDPSAQKVGSEKTANPQQAPSIAASSAASTAPQTSASPSASASVAKPQPVASAKPVAKPVAKPIPTAKPQPVAAIKPVAKPVAKPIPTAKPQPVAAVKPVAKPVAKTAPTPATTPKIETLPSSNGKISAPVMAQARNFPRIYQLLTEKIPMNGKQTLGSTLTAAFYDGATPAQKLEIQKRLVKFNQSSSISARIILSQMTDADVGQLSPKDYRWSLAKRFPQLIGQKSKAGLGRLEDKADYIRFLREAEEQGIHNPDIVYGQTIDATEFSLVHDLIKIRFPEQGEQTGALPSKSTTQDQQLGFNEAESLPAQPQKLPKSPNLQQKTEIFWQLGKILIPACPDGSYGSAKMYLENMLLLDCDSEKQQDQMLALVKQMPLTAFTEYDAMENGTIQVQVDASWIERFQQVLS